MLVLRHSMQSRQKLLLQRWQVLICWFRQRDRAAPAPCRSIYNYWNHCAKMRKEKFLARFLSRKSSRLQRWLEERRGNLVEEIEIENFEDSNRCLTSLLWPRISDSDLLFESIWSSWRIHSRNLAKSLDRPRQNLCDYLLCWATGNFVLPWNIQLWF